MHINIRVLAIAGKGTVVWVQQLVHRPEPSAGTTQAEANVRPLASTKIVNSASKAEASINGCVVGAFCIDRLSLYME